MKTTRELEEIKREQRAIQLFDYIKKCEDKEREEKKRILLDLVLVQRKQLEQKTIQLNNSRARKVALAKETRRKEMEQKREYLKSLSLQKNEKKLFKSSFYKSQEKEMKNEKLKDQLLYEKSIAKRAKMLDTADRLQYQKVETEKREPIHKPLEKNSTFQNAEEVAEFIERYTREEPPPQRQYTVTTERKETCNMEKTKLMLESLKKNKFKTKNLTGGLPNQYGFVSAISQDYEVGFRHARTLDDPTWEVNKKDPLPAIEIQDPLEYRLRDRKDTDRREKKMKHEERQIDDLDGPETDLDMQKKEKSMTQLANVAALNLTENEKTIIEKAEKQMNSDSRVSEFVKKKSRTLKIKTRFLGVKDEPISALDEPMSALDFTSTTPFLEPMPEIPDVARRRAKTIMEDNMSPGLLSPSLESGKSFHGRNSIFEKSPKKSRPTTPKRSSIIHTPMIRAATPLSPLRNEPIEQQDSFVSEGTVYTNPFGSMIQLIPEENQHQSLSEWHQKVVNQGIVEEPKMEHWNAVNVEAVAEFGTTLYTKRFLDMALAAETEGYQPQPVNVLDPDRQIRKVSRDRAGYKKVGNQKFWLLKE